MKIGFYIHHSTLKAGGIFTYSIGILKILLNSNDIEKILLIYSPEIRQQITGILNHPKIEPLEIDRRKLDIRFFLMLSYFFYDIYLIIRNYLPDTRKFDFLRSFSAFINPYRVKINRKNISLLHVPMQYSPVYSLNIPLVTTMHDLQDMHFPEYFSPQERIHRALNNKKSIESSSHIIVSFLHIKNDLIKYFNISGENISVCPPPFADNWFVDDSMSNPEMVMKKYTLPDTFILYPAATWQHKNHLMLIEALYKLKKDGQQINLICTGNKTEYYHDILAKKIDELNLNENIKFLGIIPESDLMSLYKLTKLVIIPTLYEAGSAPLYEAMRLGSPVICSNVTSLPETINNNEFVFNPVDVKMIMDKIRLSLYNDDFRKRNIKNSKTQISRLSKMDYAINFINVYNQLTR